MAGSATSMPAQTMAPGRSPVDEAHHDRHQGRADAGDGGDHPHPAGGQAAVEERRTEAVADAGQHGPRVVGTLRVPAVDECEAAIAAPPASAPTNATDQGLTREKTPPMKSERP